MTTFLARNTGTSAGRPPGLSGRPVSGWAFTGLAVTSFGGPLALAALIAPGVLADATASAGLAMVAAVALFAFPLLIWLRYARRVNGPGGLYSFVEAAAGRRIALVQAGLWIVSYLLYLAYTRFAARQHDRRLPAWTLTVVATGFALYGLWITFQHSAT